MSAVVLTPTEYRLLATLARHQGQVLSSDQLIELAWDDPSGLAPSRVKYAVLRLRRKLGWDEGDDGPIETVRGFGYRYRSRGTGERDRSNPNRRRSGRRDPQMPGHGASHRLLGLDAGAPPGLRPGRRRHRPRSPSSRSPTTPAGRSRSPASSSSCSVAAAFLLPWERLPDWAWLIIPIGYIAVIAIIRDAQGGSDSGLVVVYLLPIVWLSLYGRRLHLLVGLFCMDLALLVPLLVVGPPKYPTLEWRQVAVMATVTTLVASTVYTMVSRDRAVLADLAQQSRMARRNAREADYARDRLETLLRAATGSAIMGVDPAGTVTFFSAGAEQMLGYRAAEVVGIHSIADFIDPAQIDERRQTIDAMRTALEPRSTPRRRPRCPGPPPARTASSAAASCGCAPCPCRRRTSRSTTKGRRPDDRADEDDAGRRTDRTSPASTTSAPANGGYVVVAIDVTEREELAADRERLFAIQKEVTQSLIEQNNRLRELTQMKDDVVATVSHELRTPITSIRGFIELLLDAQLRADREPDAHARRPSTATRSSCSGWPRTSSPTRAPGAGSGSPSPSST